MINILHRILGGLLRRTSSASRDGRAAGEAGSTGAEKGDKAGQEWSRILITPEDQMDPLLARRLTQLEFSMAQLARAHLETLREREALSHEVKALRTGGSRLEEKPESPLAFNSPESVI